MLFRRPRAIAALFFTCLLQSAPAADLTPGPSPLRRTPLAEVADISALQRHSAAESLFDGGSAAHRRLAEAVENADEKRTALRTAFFLALRDGDLTSAREVQASLLKAGGEDLAWWIPDSALSAGETVAVPGGLRALATVSGSKPDAAPEDFFEHYCRTVARVAGYASEEATKLHFDNIRRYFRVLTELARYQQAPSEDAIVIMLSARDKEALKTTRRVLGLLGWNLKTSKRGVELLPGDDENQAFGQEYAAALGIDQVAMQEALTNGGAYELRVPIERARVLLGENAWRDALYSGTASPGGFAEALLSDARIAETYVGLAEMSTAAVEPLLSAIGLQRLVEKFSLVLQLYSAALVVTPEGAGTPGGPAAYDVWFNVVGAAPADPGSFFPTLLKKDDGRLLAFYFTLCQLDLDKQRFLTESTRRINSFYKAYRETPEVAPGVRRMVREDPFGQFLREIPVAPDGSLHFPGSPEIWLVAKGDAAAEKLETRARKKVTAEVEDQVLLRLMSTKFETRDGDRSQMEKFLAAARVERVRRTPLDPLTALLLAQNVAEFGGVYPYFSSLTALEAGHLQAFLAFARRIAQSDPVESNQSLGLFHGAAALAALAEERRAVAPEEAARLFGKLCQDLAHPSGPEAEVRAAFEFLRGLLEAARVSDPDNADAGLAQILFGDPSGPYGYRLAQAQQVKELQQAPSLTALMKMGEALAALQARPDDAQQRIEVLRTSVAALPDLRPPKDTPITGDLEKVIQAFSPVELRNELAGLAKSAGKKKVKAEEVRAAAIRFLGALRPFVMLALSAEVYAVYLRPDDMLIATDPWFLRKHHYSSFETLLAPAPFPNAMLMASSGSEGSWAHGGFAGFASVAGAVGLVNVRAHEANAAAYIDAVLGSVRATDWRSVGEGQVRLFALRVLAAKEWLVRAAEHESARTALGQAMFGILSASRRTMALRAVEEREWERLWGLLTLSDLYFIGERVGPDALPGSPVLTEIGRLEKGAGIEGLQGLGAVHRQLWQDGRPRLEPAGPYEIFERILSTSLVAERAAEWKLYVAWESDRRGWSLADLGPALEEAAVVVASTAAPSDLTDWRSVLSAYAARTASALEEAAQR